MNILVTGCCGFIGSNFVNYLLKNRPKYNVIGVDKLDHCSSLNNIIKEYDFETKKTFNRNIKKFIFYKTNINNIEFVSHLFKIHNITIVYNFAAQTHVDNSFTDIKSFIDDNINALYYLLEAIKIHNNSDDYDKITIIHVSTDEVYGDIPSTDFILTKNYYNPTNPYAWSKTSAELLVKSYGMSFNLQYIITRSNNVYGHNQYPEKIIPKFIYSIYKQEKCTVYGNGSALRKYLYIDDAVEAYTLIMERGKINNIYEMGTDVDYNTLDVLKSIILIMKNNTDYEKYIEYVSDRKFHDMRYMVNPNSLESLGWKNKTLFEKGLKNTIEWYINYAIPFDHFN